MSMPGAGTPQEPKRGVPGAGVKVPIAAVSVMPQPSRSQAPLAFWNAVGDFHRQRRAAGADDLQALQARPASAPG